MYQVLLVDDDQHICPGLHYIETVRRKGYRFNPDPQKEPVPPEDIP